jgi:hypothetical protein
VFKSETVKVATGVQRGALSPVTSSHPLWQSIHPRLEEGEQIYWIGQPVCRKLWNEMAVEIVFGFPFATVGIVVLGACVWVAAHGALEGLIGIAISAVVTLIGVSKLAAPWQYRRLLRKTLYAVTSRRALVIHGLLWSEGEAPFKAVSSVLSFSLDQVRGYDVVCRGRDITFGGEWRRGRKQQQYWTYTGFLAPDDLPAAESAIHCLLASCEETRSTD